MSRRNGQAALQDWQTRKARQDAKDMEWLLSSAQGRRILYRVIYEIAELESVNFNFKDEHLYFSEGMRNVGQRLLMEAKRLSSAEVVHMWTEALSARNTADLHRQAGDAENDEWKQEPPP